MKGPCKMPSVTRTCNTGASLGVNRHHHRDQAHAQQNTHTCAEETGARAFPAAVSNGPRSETTPAPAGEEMHKL